MRFETRGRPLTVDAIQNLRDLVDVKVGQPLTRENVRTSMDHLNALGRYEDIRPVVMSAPGGVIVVFELVPRFPISRVEVLSKDPDVPVSDLRTELRQRFGGVPTGVRIAAVEDAARQYLNDLAYLNPEVSVATSVEPDADTAALVVTVDPGPLATIARSRVEGTSPLPESEILKRVRATTGQPFRRREIETALSVVEDDLRAQRYYEAQASLQASVVPDGVDIVVAVDTGPRVELRIEPPNALPGNVSQLIPIEQQRSADQDLLEDAKARIERALRQDGYASASAPFTRELSADGTVLVITFRASRGPRYFVDRVEIPSELQLPLAMVASAVAIKPGEVFNEERFQAGLSKVIEEYRRRGYYRAEAKPERETIADRSTATETWVVLHPAITEGPRGVIKDIAFRFEGPHRLSDTELRQALRSKAGAPYVELDAAQDQDALVTLYRERGFLSASVGLSPEFSTNGTEVVLPFTINEGTQVLVGRITVIGNDRVSEQQILEELRLASGQPLSASALTTARQRLAAMGVFRRISVEAADRLGGESEAHIVVTVVEAPANNIGFGFGLEAGTFARQDLDGTIVDRVEFAPRGFFEIGRRNLGGRNRSVSLFTRIGLRRNTREELPGAGNLGSFTEYRVTGTFREFHAFRSDMDLLVSISSEQAIRPTYNYLRRVANAEFLRRIGPKTIVTGGYALDYTELFDDRIPEGERPEIDRLFPQVRLSMVSAGVFWDGRDSVLAPTRGNFLSGDVEIALRAIGSEVGYVKTFYQVSNFRRIGTTGAATVLGLRGQLGLARGFNRPVTVIGDLGEVTTGVVRDLPISQRFFAGGGTTVRGFPQDRLGVFNPPPEPGDILPPQSSVINPRTGLSVGGNAVVVLNAELRRVVRRLFARNLAVVGFVDGGNVFARVAHLDLGRIRGTAGFGMRYDSPLGPLRLDFGFKFDRIMTDLWRESAWEYHLSIGEAF